MKENTWLFQVKFQPVLADVINFIEDGKIPEPACQQFQAKKIKWPTSSV